MSSNNPREEAETLFISAAIRARDKAEDYAAKLSFDYFNKVRMLEEAIAAEKNFLSQRIVSRVENDDGTVTEENQFEVLDDTNNRILRNCLTVYDPDRNIIRRIWTDSD